MARLERLRVYPVKSLDGVDFDSARITEGGVLEYDREAGPSVVSTATIREVSTWFDDVSADGLRRRIRANVEVGGVPAFWEDRFVDAAAPTFAVGDVRFEGVEPCIRCGVPERDPGTGERTPDFRKRCRPSLGELVGVNPELLQHA